MWRRIQFLQDLPFVAPEHWLGLIKETYRSLRRGRSLSVALAGSHWGHRTAPRPSVCASFSSSWPAPYRPQTCPPRVESSGTAGPWPWCNLWPVRSGSERLRRFHSSVPVLSSWTGIPWNLHRQLGLRHQCSRNNPPTSGSLAKKIYFYIWCNHI